MRIAVISEVSARDKNAFILEALREINTEVFNIGMADGTLEPELTYIHTGLMAALALETGAADFVIGGCGTGLGFLMSVMQYPKVFCGLIIDPVDAWLFSQINGGNCVSLALNKGFGWAADINLKYIFEKLFCDEAGRGYPPHRSKSQQESRKLLEDISRTTHMDFASILERLDKSTLETVLSHKAFTDFISSYGSEGEIRDIILNR
ncbi:MAG: ribose-5-phosphate isomerase [Firmicutes bacterium HGW-Firmicutes-16]|nr:MAG: ribose-5-phosphate isomerase [Firmicutes bacterium HGW-Firmicutes-16]